MTITTNDKVDISDALYECCKLGGYKVFTVLLDHTNTIINVNKHPLLHAVCQSLPLLPPQSLPSTYYKTQISIPFLHTIKINNAIRMTQVLLLLTNIDVNQPGHDGLTPLQLCELKNNVVMSDLLLSDNRVNVHQKNED